MVLHCDHEGVPVTEEGEYYDSATGRILTREKKPSSKKYTISDADWYRQFSEMTKHIPDAERWLRHAYLTTRKTQREAHEDDIVTPGINQRFIFI